MALNDTVTSQTVSPSWEDQLNTTGNSSTTEPELSLYTYPERVAMAVFFLLISVVGIVGNSTVILAVVFSRKPRTATNVFVVNLSAADLLTGLALPTSVIAMLSPGDTWPFSTEALCFVGGLLLYISAGTSLLNLACIALNRAVLIKRPTTTYLRLYTKRNLAIMVAAIWVISVSVLLIPPLFDVGGYGLDRQHRVCTDLPEHPRAKTFDQIQIYVFYIVPLLVIFTSYAVIFINVRRHFKTQKANIQQNSADTASSSVGKANWEAPTSPTVPQDHRLHRISREQIQITKNLFTAVCLFFLFTTPYFLVNVITKADRFMIVAAIIFLCNSCANPIVYAAKHPQFKQVIRCMLQGKYSQIEEPSGALKALRAFCSRAK